jgi:DNA-binding XRE family transcriptional regulator
MPRKPKLNHPLRRLRLTLGMTQPKFATMVSVSSDTIKSVESGRLKMSASLAFLIATATGVDDASIRSKTGRPLALLTGREFELADAVNWQKEPDNWQTQVDNSIKDLNRIFAVARNKKQFQPVYLRFSQWIGLMEKALGVATPDYRVMSCPF